MAYLNIENLTKSFGEGRAKVSVLNEVDMSVEKGEICTVLGQSGSGKSTLLTAVLGALLGTADGFMLTGSMAASSDGLYSFPEITHVFPLYLPAYAIGLPTIFSYIINCFVLSRKLNSTPLKMMREAPKQKKTL